MFMAGAFRVDKFYDDVVALFRKHVNYHKAEQTICCSSIGKQIRCQRAETILQYVELRYSRRVDSPITFPSPIIRCLH